MNQTESMIVQNLPYTVQFNTKIKQILGVKTYEQLMLDTALPGNRDYSPIELNNNVVTIPQNVYNAVLIDASLLVTTPVDTATQVFIRVYEHKNGEMDQSHASQVSLIGETAHGGQHVFNTKRLLKTGTTTSGYSFAVYVDKDECSLYQERSFITLTPFARI